ncbi:translation elongation factor Ts [Marinicella sp. S1101]|uniref:translation elongation factor Ts n=1 Tax=Marinicella marina TaxID=2996016 RepID=UPI002260F2A2|nr:translation elongation factor Ts [Marinicella marina]MCX7554805.1 translation elongation factor Ts [Marinicella marina]MDJ1140962.1 translation elongation factor Ts [Marinicella marina]
MSITAAMVKELREITGAGMMECKKALVETDGNIEVAIENMRKSGAAKAAKKSGRVAADGIVKVAASADNKTAVLVEVNCETDFVAKDENFLGFTDAVVNAALDAKATDVETVMAVEIDGKSLEQLRTDLVAKIGENIQVRRVQLVECADGAVGHYSHGKNIGVVVATTGGDEELIKDLAMHIAAANPEYISEAQVPAAQLEKEKEILVAQAQDSGKPAEIIEKMVGGRIRKYLAEITLVGQPFVKDPDMTVEKLLNSKNANVVEFVRFEVGEGIEKKVDNFVEEVMAQARGN